MQLQSPAPRMRTCTEYTHIGGLTVKPLAVVSLVVLTLPLVVSSTAHAALLDFVVEPPHAGGSIRFDGGNPLSGSAIGVARVIGVDTPSNAALAAACVDCSLTFTSGAFAGYNAAFNIWDFGPGGSIAILGGVDLTGDGDADDASDIAPGSLLLGGSFNAARVLGLSGGTYSFQIAGGDFLDTKHSDLLTFYGLPTDIGYQGNLNLSFLAQMNPDGNPLSADFISATNGIGSGDIINQPTVPLPAAIWLLGSGVIGMTAVARRRHPV